MILRIFIDCPMLSGVLSVLVVLLGVINLGQLPSLPFPKSDAGPSLLLRLLAGKYRDHLPLHRRIAIFARGGVHLKAATVCDRVQDSILRAARQLRPISPCMTAHS